MQAVVSFPSSEAEWRQALAAVHPDRTGQPEPFIEATKARDVWRDSQPLRCLHCHRAFIVSNRPKQRCCSIYCSNQIIGLNRRKQRVLKRIPVVTITEQNPLRSVVMPAVEYHARHTAVFGAAFSKCQHTACVRARRRKVA